MKELNFINLYLSNNLLLINIENSGLYFNLIKECIARFTPHKEFNLNRLPVLGSLKLIKCIGLLNVLAKLVINFASVKVV